MTNKYIIKQYVLFYYVCFTTAIDEALLRNSYRVQSAE